MSFIESIWHLRDLEKLEERQLKERQLEERQLEERQLEEKLEK